jgi:glycosyltransferase involved in cell wall biosynthesis
MRIGVNCFLLQVNMGGLRQYFHRLFRELLNNDSKNSYVFFYFEQNIKEMELLGNERWKKEAIFLKDQKEAKGHLDKIDLYFCPFGAIWPRPFPRPSVVTLVDIQEKYYPQFFTQQDIWNREFHYEGSTRAADQVITISEFSKNSIVQHHRISRDKIHVVYLAADESLYLPFRSEEKIGLELPEHYIFYPANRWLHKNHDNLLRALVILKQEHHLRMDCVLTGFDYENGYPLEEKVKEYGLKDQIKIIGYVNLEEMRHLYQKAELLCFPSLFEGFGMPLVEAMVMGCPIVCSNATSIPEVVGEAALFFNPDDPYEIANKIRLLWNNRDLRERLATLGKERARYFSVKRLAERHLEVFHLAGESYRRRHYIFYKYVREPLHTLKMFEKRRKWALP